MQLCVGRNDRVGAELWAAKADAQPFCRNAERKSHLKNYSAGPKVAKVTA
jgi:hypothetical protein